MNESTKISIFNEKQIRKILFEGEWYFSVVDICSVLIESPDSGAYWRKLKQRLVAEGSEVVTFFSYKMYHYYYKRYLDKNGYIVDLL